jgi:valyl-tRNA synthetase
MDKAYEARHDEKWQKHWDQEKLASPEGVHRRQDFRQNETFSLLMPPPNVTGVLHQGHALMLALEDTLTRWKRMSGVESLYLPGTDHASIAVQMQVVKFLDSKGINHRDLGREAFIEECWKWIRDYQPRIFKQIKTMGVNCDWERVKFTMDPDLNQSVTHAFVELHKKGLIYRAEKLVNWSPKGQTVLSDLEVVFKEQKGFIWHLKYPLASDPTKFLVVATTRPETMLGDVAVAVHPDDPRYKDWIGKNIRLPIVDREIPVVADTFVEKDFGSGAVKITPAHDFNDFEVGQRNNLPLINIFDPEAKLLKGLPAKASEWAGLDRFVARDKVVEEFKRLGLLEKVEEHQNRIGTSERWGDVVEPYLSHQWFLKMDGMAAKSKAAVEAGKIEFVPREFHNQFMRWMENIHDWCISRQLWWGHRIPAYHCKKSGKIVVSETAPANTAEHEWEQDSDVLDTWFSSGIWPLSTLGWPQADAVDMKKFYPTQVLETGFDILFFWVARMVMMCLEFTDEVPFKKVYMHPMVRDEHGQKMSKTKGNVIDPLDIMQELGADTLRLALNGLCVQGRDLRLSAERLDHYRNFINKIWNATRFALMPQDGLVDDVTLWKTRDPKPQHLHDQWILARLDQTSRDLNKAWSEFRMQEAIEILYHFVWSDYCDWYLECAKSTRKDSDRTVKHVLGEILKMFHPVCPHVTEELWHQMPAVAQDDYLLLQRFPQGEGFPQSEIFAEFKFFQDLVVAVRSLKADAKLPPSKSIRVWLKGLGPLSQKVLDRSRSTFMSLAKVENLEWGDVSNDLPSTRVPVTAVEAGKNIELIVPLTELKDLAEECERLRKEVESLSKLCVAQESKLSNKSFVDRAPPEVVDKERVKLEEYKDKLLKLQATIADLQRINK